MPAILICLDQPRRNRCVNRPEYLRKKQEKVGQEQRHCAVGCLLEVKPQQSLDALLHAKQQRRGREKQLPPAANPRERGNANGAGEPGGDKTC